MADEPSKNTRTYRLLIQGEDEKTGRPYYVPIGKVVASTPSQAIRLAVADYGGAPFVAVPEGNWTWERYTSEPQPPKISRVNDVEPDFPQWEPLSDTESAAPVAAGDLDFPGEASGVGNESGAGAAGELSDEEVATLAGAMDAEQEPLVEDAEYQERKAEIAARRT